MKQDFKLKKISQEELNEILKQHELWVKSRIGNDGARADLSFYDLRGLKFPTEVNLLRADLEGADLEGANLMGANFMGANLMGAKLSRANLMLANLMGVNLIRSVSLDVNFRGAILSRAILFRANLSGAILRGATLRAAILSGANLRGTDFEGADFEGSSLEGADFEGANLRGTDFEGVRGVPYHIYLTNNTNLEERIIQQQFKINQLEQELQQAQAENNQSQEQQEKIAKLEKQLELAKQQEQKLQRIKDKKVKQEQEIKVILEGNINQAHEALKNALTNTGEQITNNQKFSTLLKWGAVVLIGLDIVFVITIPILILFGKFNDLLDKVGIWAILFFTFPALLILLIALSLLRHQKQLIAEIRHYSMLKHKIELYGGILKAAQYTASSVIQSQNSEAAKYIQETFNEIKVELLKSPNFDLNAQPHIFPEEGGNLVEMLKSITELLKISTEANKAIAESAKKATTSEKSNL